MDDRIDLGPSGMRLAEIGALQERVRVLEAGMNDTLHPDDVAAAAGAYEDNWFVGDLPKRMHLAIVAYNRSRRARALSELAAADAELLEPPT